MVFDKEIVGDFSVFVGDELDAGGLRRLLIHLRIPYKYGFFFLQVEPVEDLFNRFGMRLRVLHIEGCHHHIEKRPESKPLHDMGHRGRPVRVDRPEDPVSF